MARNGTVQTLELLADTGNPYALILSASILAASQLFPGPSTMTNFGLLVGGQVRVVIPDVGFDQVILGYASDVVVAATHDSSPDFAGMAGLPLLRMMEYGGDLDCFWIRTPPASPSLVVRGHS
jgi:hypothetical protein